MQLTCFYIFPRPASLFRTFLHKGDTQSTNIVSYPNVESKLCLISPDGYINSMPTFEG